MYCLLQLSPTVNVELFFVFFLLNTIMMDKWLETSSLKCTLEKCEGNVSFSNNCDKNAVI
jgi:hypothetical protein